MPRTWLYAAFGLSAALAILGAYAIINAQAELASGKRSVTMIGEVICLPHKKPWFGLFGGGGAETLECRFGFLGKDGNYYGIGYDSGNEYFWASAHDSGELLISGKITIPPDAFHSPEGLERYDIVGVIEIDYATSIDR